RFMNEAAARKWVEDNTGTGPEPLLAAKYTQPLMAEALKRVVAYTPPAPDPAGSAPATPQPAAEPAPAAPASPAVPQNGWLLWAGGLAALAVAASSAALWWRRRSPKR
ncbi:MAG: hypothetical protein ACM3XM_07630, partial [Mycobacterium leprae]